MLLLSKSASPPDALAKLCQLPLWRLNQVLANLERWRLIQRQGAAWKVLRTAIHIAKVHPLANVHHRNMHELSQLPALRASEQGLRYSGVYSLSRESVGVLRTECMRFIDQTRAVVTAATDETALFFSLDFCPLEP
jgi:hypothetical protein